MTAAPTFHRHPPAAAGWYAVVFENQAPGTYEDAYFEPGCDHVALTRKRHLPVVEVAGWGPRVPSIEETLG